MDITQQTIQNLAIKIANLEIELAQTQAELTLKIKELEELKNKEAKYVQDTK